MLDPEGRTIFAAPEYDVAEWPEADAWYAQVGGSWVAVIDAHEKNTWFDREFPWTSGRVRTISDIPTGGRLRYRVAPTFEEVEVYAEDWLRCSRCRRFIEETFTFGVDEPDAPDGGYCEVCYLGLRDQRPETPTHDGIVHLPSGTELSVQAAIGDVLRAREALTDDGLVADLGHVAELLKMLAPEIPADPPPKPQPRAACPNCGNSEFDERGNVRCYIEGEMIVGAGPNGLEIVWKSDGWTTPIDTFEADDAPFVCLACDLAYEHPSDLMIVMPETAATSSEQA